MYTHTYVLVCDIVCFNVYVVCVLALLMCLLYLLSSSGRMGLQPTADDHLNVEIKQQDILQHIALLLFNVEIEVRYTLQPSKLIQLVTDSPQSACTDAIQPLRGFNMHPTLKYNNQRACRISRIL